MSNKQDDVFIYYPDSECEKHDNVVTTEPVCLVCMYYAIHELSVEDLESLCDQFRQDVLEKHARGQAND